MADEDYKIKLSAKDDIDHLDMEDYVPHELLKVYPYQAVFGSREKVFQETNTITIVRISQFDPESQVDEANSVDIFNNLKLDEYNNKYMRMYGVHTEQTGTFQMQSNNQETIRKIKNFTALVNNYIETDQDKPVFIVIGEPFDLVKFESGKQNIYFVESTTPANKDIQLELQEAQWVIDDDDAIAEMNLVDISELEKQYDGSKIVFTTDVSFGKDVITHDGNNVSGITLDMQQSTKIHSIKAKGMISEIGSEPFYGNVDFHSKEKLTPFRSSLIADEDKVEMQADWSNSQLIMPQFIAEQFKDGKAISDVVVELNKAKWHEYHLMDDGTYGPVKDGQPTYEMDLKDVGNNTPVHLQVTGAPAGYIGPSKWFEPDSFNWDVAKGKMTVHIKPGDTVYLQNRGPHQTFLVRYKIQEEIGSILNQEDMCLIEDMLILSAGYADDWAKAPVFTAGSEVGHIKTDFRVGHGGIKVSTIQRSNPRDIIDGLLETHIRKYPDFVNNKQRNFLAMSTIAALSRYIYGSHSIADGGNNFNEIYLPWYLEITASIGKIINKIDYSSHFQTIENPDAGLSGDVKTYLLKGAQYVNKTWTRASDIKFTSKSHYFRTDFTNNIKLAPTNEMVLPVEPNISDTIITQTDRKMMLPQLRESIKDPKKINFAKDIKAEKDLEFLWWLPIPEDKWKEFYIESFNTTRITKAGEHLTYTIPRRAEGVIWTDKQAEDEIKKIYKHIKFDIANGDKKPVESKEIKEHDFTYYNTQDRNVDYNITVIKVDGITIYSHRTDRGWPHKNYHAGGLTPNQIKDIIAKYRHIDANSIKIYDKNKKELTGSNLAPSGVHDGRVGFLYSTFSEARFTVTQDLSEGIYSFQQRPFKFDQQGWNRLLVDHGINPIQFKEVNLIQEKDFQIKELHKLDIYYMWGQKFKLKLGGKVWKEFDLNNQYDEVITKQSIIIW